jgi:hypothetical protein
MFRLLFVIATSTLLTLPSSLKPFTNLHVSHSGGTFICSLAQLNQENVRKTTNCNWFHDNGGGKNIKYRNCYNRGRERPIFEIIQLKRNISFFAVERGLLEDEFCPNLGSYMIFFRNPILVAKSILSTHQINDMESYSRQFTDPKSSRYPIDTFLKRFYNSSSKNSLNMVKIPLVYHADNYFTRFLSFNASVYYSPLRSISLDNYNLALSNLRRIDVVFTDTNLIHDVDKVGRVLHDQLGWNQSYLTVNSNSPARKNSHGPHNISSELNDHIVKWNQYDMMLYGQATELFHHRFLQKKI